MKYKELIDSCREAIANERCLGCQALENPYFTGNENCIFLKELIDKNNTGIQERIKL